MSDRDLELDFTIRSAESTASIDKVQRKLAALKKELSKIQGLKDLAPSSKDLKAFQGINQALKDTGVSIKKGLTEHLKEAKKHLQDGTFDKHFAKIATGMERLDRTLLTSSAKRKKISEEGVKMVKAYAAAIQIRNNAGRDELKLLRQVERKEAEVADKRERHRLIKLRFQRDLQAERKKSDRLAQRATGRFEEVNGNKWGPNNNAHLGQFKALRRQDNEFLRQQRWRLKVMDNTANAEANEVRKKNAAYWREQRQRLRFRSNADKAEAKAVKDAETAYWKQQRFRIGMMEKSERLEAKQDRIFWQQQRATISRMDRSENLEKRRLKTEEMAARRIVREQELQRRNFRNSLSSAGHHARDSVMSMSHPFFSSPAFAAEAALTSALAGLTEVIRATKPFDKAMTDLSIRGDMSRSQAEARGRDALNNAIDFGVAPEHFVNIEKEAAARGLPAELAKGLGPMIMKFAEATGQRPEQASEHTSEFIQQLMSMGRLGKGSEIKDNIFKTLNSTAVIANKFGTPEKMMQAMESGLAERGAELNLNPQDTVTLAGLMNSSGARTGQFTTRAMGLLSKGAPNWKAEWLKKLDSMDDPRSRAFVTAPQKMGYSGIDAMASDAHGDNGLKGILRFFESFNNIKDTSERKMVEEQLGFTEQLAAIVTGMSESGDKLKRAQEASDQAYGEKDDGKSYLSRAQNKYRSGLEYMLGVLSTGFETMAISIGEGFRQKVISKILGPWQQLSHWSVDNLPMVINQIVDSFMDGLGFKSFTDRAGDHNGVSSFMESLSSSVRSVDWNHVAQDVGKAIKGIGKGLVTLKNDFVYAMGWLSKITGGDGSIETLAKLTTEVFGFALALHTLSPVIGIFTSIISACKLMKGLYGLAKVAIGMTDLSVALRAIVGVEMAGSAAGLLKFAGSLGVIATAIALLEKLGVLSNIQLMPKDSSKEEVSKWLWGVDKDGKANVPSIAGHKLWNSGPHSRGSQGPTADEQKMQGLFQLNSYSGGDFHGLISKASYTPSDSGEVIRESVVGTESGVVAVKNEIQETNSLLKELIIKGFESTGINSVGGASPGAANMRYGPGGHTPGGGGPRAGGGSGGSRSWRNNNPGNIEYGPFAKSMGAIGTDGRFAVFPSYQAGRKAQEHLLFESSAYKNLTLGQAIAKWAPGGENNVPAYIAAMHGDPNAKMSSFSPEQRAKLLDAMQAHEGWKVGTAQNKLLGGSSSGRSVHGPVTGAGSVPVEVAGRKVMVGGKYAANFKGFMEDWVKAGGTLGPNTGGYRNSLIAGTNTPSFHSEEGGRAMDINQLARNRITGGLPGGIAAEEALAHKWGLRAGSEFRNPDRGHYEVNDPAAAAEALKRNAEAIKENTTHLKEATEVHKQGSAKAISEAIHGQSADSIAKKVPSRARPHTGTEDPVSAGKHAPQMDNADAGGGRSGHTFHMAFHSNVTDHHALARAVSQQIEQTVATRTHDVDHDVS